MYLVTVILSILALHAIVEALVLDSEFIHVLYHKEISSNNIHLALSINSSPPQLRVFHRDKNANEHALTAIPFYVENILYAFILQYHIKSWGHGLFVLENPCIFDAQKYSEKYHDLQNAFHGEANDLKRHFIESGLKEGRTPCGNTTTNDNGQRFFTSEDHASKKMKEYKCYDTEIVQKWIYHVEQEHSKASQNLHPPEMLKWDYWASQFVANSEKSLNQNCETYDWLLPRLKWVYNIVPPDNVRNKALTALEESFSRHLAISFYRWPGVYVKLINQTEADLNLGMKTYINTEDTKAKEEFLCRSGEPISADKWHTAEKLIGITMAHWSLWQYIAKGQLLQAHDYILIIENDVLCAYGDASLQRCIKSSFDAVQSAEEDIVYLGWCYDQLECPRCTHAYALTQTGAQKLIKSVYPCGGPVDKQMCDATKVESVLVQGSLGGGGATIADQISFKKIPSPNGVVKHYQFNRGIWIQKW